MGGRWDVPCIHSQWPHPLAHAGCSRAGYTDVLPHPSRAADRGFSTAQAGRRRRNAFSPVPKGDFSGAGRLQKAAVSSVSHCTEWVLQPLPPSCHVSRHDGICPRAPVGCRWDRREEDHHGAKAPFLARARPLCLAHLR